MQISQINENELVILLCTNKLSIKYSFDVKQVYEFTLLLINSDTWINQYSGYTCYARLIWYLHTIMRDISNYRQGICAVSSLVLH